MEVVDVSWSDVEWLRLVRRSTLGANQHGLLHHQKHGWITAYQFGIVVVDE